MQSLNDLLSPFNRYLVNCCRRSSKKVCLCSHQSCFCQYLRWEEEDREPPCQQEKIFSHFVQPPKSRLVRAARLVGAKTMQSAVSGLLLWPTLSKCSLWKHVRWERCFVLVIDNFLISPEFWGLQRSHTSVYPMFALPKRFNNFFWSVVV